MERQFFSGNTIEQAVMAAARHYGIDPDRVAYSLRDKKHGFLNIRRRVVIEVDPTAPEKPEKPEKPETAETAAAPAAGAAAVPVREARERRPADRAAPGRPDRGAGRTPEREADRGPRERRGRSVPTEEVWDYREAMVEELAAETYEQGDDERQLAALEIALDEVLELADLDVEGTVVQREDGFEIELAGEDADIVVGAEGEVLRAIEHLLPRLVRGLLGHGVPCSVDCDGFQETRNVELRELASGMAEAARLQGREQILEPMSPMDRRVVHLELADDPTVSTESEGEGYMKRVKILPRDVSRET